MAEIFRADAPFDATDFPDEDKPFPIVEMFGFHRELRSTQARDAFNRRWCPFANNPCEKYRQYGYAYCSVTYKAVRDTQTSTYAVCDHRLDGELIQLAIEDYFGPLSAEAVLVPEVVLTNPRQSFDFIGLERDGDRFIGIEAQAIDLRGGGVGPANAAILGGDPRSWRSRFSAEAVAKGRKDTVAYGVNTANIYKRLGLQVAEKAAMLRAWGSKLYVIAQHRSFQYLQRRVDVSWTEPGDWDITFITFDYTGEVDANGQMATVPMGKFRTTVAQFSAALVNPTSTVSAADFLRRVRKKAGLDH